MNTILLLQQWFLKCNTMKLLLALLAATITPTSKSKVDGTGIFYFSNKIPCYFKCSLSIVRIADDPCQGLHIFIGNQTNANVSVPELAVGKWPNLKPTFNNLEWTSYDWGFQDLFIDPYDPSFDGGNTCGFYRNETCYYTIGVYGYCVANLPYVDFSMIVEKYAGPVNNIYKIPQANQEVGFSSLVQYGFCASTHDNMRAEFQIWKDAAQCPTMYAHLQMVISRTNPKATIGDLTWSIDHDEEYDYIDLLTSDPSTRDGTYYLNVYGWCNGYNQCSDPCTCEPCQNIVNTKFGVYVRNLSDANSYVTPSTYLGTCNDSYAMINVCSSSSSSNKKLSGGAIAGIVIAVLIFFALLVVGFFYCFRYALGKVSLLVSSLFLLL